MENYIAKTNLELAIETKNLEVIYGDHQVVFDSSLEFPRHKITAIIGASGSGKSTYLRSLNRMHDKTVTVNGQIVYRGVDINQPSVNAYEVRKQIGMVFQRPNPFAKSIRNNLVFPLKENGITDKRVLDERVEESLKEAALWDEVKDDLNKSALELSGGQQQRLCIARALALRPDILLMDEPASALDPISTEKVEATMRKLRRNYTIIIVTHNMQQASRVSDFTTFFHQGRVVEFAPTQELFQTPRVKITEDYISGNFG